MAYVAYLWINVRIEPGRYFFFEFSQDYIFSDTHTLQDLIFSFLELKEDTGDYPDNDQFGICVNDVIFNRTITASSYLRREGC